MTVERGKASSATWAVAGISTDLREEQPWKAQMPILVTDDGIDTLLKLEQP